MVGRADGCGGRAEPRGLLRRGRGRVAEGLLVFQKVDDPTPGKNRVHLDLTAVDLEAEVDRLVSGGATVVGRRGDEGFRWVTMADPQGNQFCVAGQAEAAASY